MRLTDASLLSLFPARLCYLAVMELRWMQASPALPQGWETLVLPTAGAQVAVRCRDPLSWLQT